MTQIVNIVFIINLFCMIGLITALRTWQRTHGKLSETRIALIMVGSLSFVTISTLAPLFTVRPGATALIDLVLLLLLWGIGYPWARWLVRKIRSVK